MTQTTMKRQEAMNVFKHEDYKVELIEGLKDPEVGIFTRQ